MALSLQPEEATSDYHLRLTFTTSIDPTKIPSSPILGWVYRIMTSSRLHVFKPRPLLLGAAARHGHAPSGLSYPQEVQALHVSCILALVALFFSRLVLLVGRT
jgi:hypothetical protein